METTGHRSRPTGVAPRSRGWRVVAGVEVALAIAAVALDLLLPALVILGLAAVSLVVRCQGPGSLGLDRLSRPGRLALHALGLAVVWFLGGSVLCTT